MKILVAIFILLLSGCSMFGHTGVEIAPYQVLQSDSELQIELRYYDRLVLVSAPMSEGNDRNSAFSRLFKYISGNNVKASKIDMTAPVFMDEEQAQDSVQVPMTAPVFVAQNTKQPLMSFVLPASYTMDTAPVPKDAEVTLSEITDLQVAVIRFSGLLREVNIKKHKDKLMRWIESEGYQVTGASKVAGYNPPFTLPALRRNEVLVPVKS